MQVLTCERGTGAVVRKPSSAIGLLNVDSPFCGCVFFPTCRSKPSLVRDLPPPLGHLARLSIQKQIEPKPNEATRCPQICLWWPLIGMARSNRSAKLVG